MTFATPAGTSAVPSASRWRTLDIVVTAVLGVAFGVVFWVWGLLFVSLDPLFAAAKPLQYVISGVWLLPAVVAPLIVRKPGAALFGEVVAAAVSGILGSIWGLDVLLSGFVQGAAAELVFAFALYSRWTLPVAMAAGAAAAVGEALHDIVLYGEFFGSLAAASGMELGTFLAAVAAVMVVSGVVIAGVGGWLLVRALRRAGVLESFPSTP